METDIPELVISTELQETIHGFLQQQTEGISEYELIKHLTQLGYFSFPGSTPWSAEELFRVHFILFHLLYNLRDHLFENKVATLEIHSLKIQLLPYAPGNSGLDRHNKLREYYLDIENLLGTNSDDVYELLAAFWNGLNSFKNREQALSVLNLVDPVDDMDIKRRFRQLARQHHPDKGGTTEEFQAICSAAQTLLPTR